MKLQSQLSMFAQKKKQIAEKLLITIKNIEFDDTGVMLRLSLYRYNHW